MCQESRKTDDIQASSRVAWIAFVLSAVSAAAAVGSWWLNQTAFDGPHVYLERGTVASAVANDPDSGIANTPNIVRGTVTLRNDGGVDDSS